MGRIDWKIVVPQAVEQARQYRSEYDTAPTLRGIYYRLVSIEAIPNTRGAYRGLSAALTKARLGGQFPWDLMVDNVRAATAAGNETDLDTVQQWASTEVRDNLNNLERSFNKIKDPNVNFRIGKWAGQDKRVILAIEKDAILGAVQNVTAEWDVQIFPLRGYSSTTFMKKIADHIRRLSRHGDVQLIIVTDFDPSGEDISRDVQDRLQYTYGVDVEAEKILLTKTQIEDYNLPAIPDDAEEIAKMQRDPRWNKWVDGIFRVELDAMAAIEPEAFRTIMNEAIAVHFDEELYDSQVEEAETACEEAEEALRELYEEIEEVHAEVQKKIDAIREEQGL